MYGDNFTLTLFVSKYFSIPANWKHSKYQINIKYNKILGY